MKSTFLAVLAACLSMLVTSGVVAFATAAPARPEPTAVAAADIEADQYVSAFIDAQYRRAMAGEHLD
jgi:hypothetical protein